MPLPPPSREKPKLTPERDIHPYVIKLDMKLEMMRHVMNNIFDMADSNLVLTDAKSGLNDFSMNYEFADKLDNLSKDIHGLADRITDKASEIRDKVEKARDTKRKMQDVQLVAEVTNQMKKCDVAREQPKRKIKPFKLSEQFNIKTEYCNETDSDDEQDNSKKLPPNGDPDGHFSYPKTNENDAAVHSFVCSICEKVFRDRNELRNHATHHKMEYYRCIICLNVFRSLRSFENHTATHSLKHTCQVCMKTFELKTTLKNHLAVHSAKNLPCSVTGCERIFKHRGNQLEHINWAHRQKKECPCTHCPKMFQTPSSMRTHRIHKHGYVEEITPAHPLAGKCKLTNSVPQTANKKKR